MKTRLCFASFLQWVLIIVAFFGSHLVSATTPIPVEGWQQPQGISFTENKGQLADDSGRILDRVLFYAQSDGLKIYITDAGITYFFLQQVETGESNEQKKEAKHFQWERIDMDLEFAHIEKEMIERDKEIQFVTNYYYPHCPDGVLNVHSYERLVVQDIYPGIDWVIYTKSENGSTEFKQDFVVHPGADYKQVRLHYRGPDSLLTKIHDGGLDVRSGLGSIDESGLVGLSENKRIQMHYQSLGENRFEFVADESIDLSKNFVIDPNVLVWATYYGGSLLDYGTSICSNGLAAWVAGTTSSTNLPCQDVGGGAYYQGTLAASNDLFVLRFEATTSIRLCATYYGGNADDIVGALHFDGTSVFVTGSSLSTNFPTQNPGGGAYYQSAKSTAEDMILVKFSNVGVCQWATYYGGDGLDMGTSIFSNATSVFVTGYSQSTNFPAQNPGGGAYYQATMNGTQNAVILKFAVSGVRNWSTYYGGDDTDEANGLHVNGTNVYMVGKTNSSDFPVQNPGGGAFFQGSQTDGPEGFVVRFNTSGVRSWGTYYGGNDDEGFNAVFCDGTYVWVTGYAVSSDFPTLNYAGSYFQATQGADASAVLLRFSLTGVRSWATFYGGNVNTIGSAIYSSGTSVWVVGSTESDDLPTQDPGNGAFFQNHNSNLPNIISESWDMFLLEFNSACIRQWATYYGKEEDDHGESVWYDGTYLFVTGTTVSNDLFLVDPGGGAYYQASCNGCGFTVNETVILKFGLPIFQSVDLVSIQASEDDSNVRIEWITATEINNDFFSVQHSRDGNTWKEIGRVDGHGNCQVEQHYSMMHYSPVMGWNYYRLQQFDFNGDSEFSPIAEVMMVADNLSFVPNPSNAFVKIVGDSGSELRAVVYDSMGRVVMNELFAKDSAKLFSVENLPNGIHTVLITNNGRTTSLKLVVQH